MIYWLVVWNMTFIFPYIYMYIYIYIGNKNPTWLSYFQRGRSTTGQPPVAVTSWHPGVMCQLHPPISQSSRTFACSSRITWRWPRIPHLGPAVGNESDMAVPENGVWPYIYIVNMSQLFIFVWVTYFQTYVLKNRSIQSPWFCVFLNTEEYNEIQSDSSKRNGGWT